jgi:hypothetical protein
MREQPGWTEDPASGKTSLLIKLLSRSEEVLVKKLSNNDRDWARFSNKHQAGVYIPPLQRDGGFFPSLIEKQREKDEDKPIRETFFRTLWPAIEEMRTDTRLVHYTSKGPETHLTRLPKAAFAELSPASFLVMARMKGELGTTFCCLTVDSASDDALALADMLDIGPDFRIAVFNSSAAIRAKRDRVLSFAEQVLEAWSAGSIQEFAAAHAKIPSTQDLALQARLEWFRRRQVANLDPFALACPGDALREISRAVEWDLFREYQHREKAVALVRLVLGDIAGPVTPAIVIKGLVDLLPQIDALMLSASQQRKSRAGYSFEHHIECMLSDGRVPFEKQVIIEAKKRPDFVLPSLRILRGSPSAAAPGLILSAKTTLRERWKQVEREMKTNELYLATVDENIAGNAIEEMAGMGIKLVVPEGIKTSKESEYEKQANVLTFRQFFDVTIRPRLSSWP